MELHASNLYVIFGVLIMLLFVVGLFGVWADLADRSTAISEFKDIANAIENAWNSGEEQTVKITINQRTMPSALSRGSHFTRYGDPEYVIYYESFPLEEDRAWTNYVDFKDRRAQTWVDAKEVGWTIDFPEGYGEFIETLARDDTVVSVSNLMVDSLGSVKLISGSDSEDTVFSWNSNDFDPLEKTMIKTRVCGDNSLCMKEHGDIVVHKLDTKKINNQELQYVELVKAGRNVPFYLASPCKSVFKVYKDTCTCTPLKDYPIYSYNEEKEMLEEKGVQSVCGHWTLSDATQILNVKTDVPCVKVEEIEYQGGFCYTSSDFTPTLEISPIIGTIILISENFEGAWVANPLSWPKHVVG